MPPSNSLTKYSHETRFSLTARMMTPPLRRKGVSMRILPFPSDRTVGASVYHLGANGDRFFHGDSLPRAFDEAGILSTPPLSGKWQMAVPLSKLGQPKSQPSSVPPWCALAPTGPYVCAAPRADPLAQPVLGENGLAWKAI